VIICSYPLSSVGMLLAAGESASSPDDGRRHGRLQATVFKDKLKSKLNGIVNYETWVPSQKLMAPAADFFRNIRIEQRLKASTRLATTSADGAMPICRCWRSRSQAQKASTTTRLPTTCRAHEFKTIMADVKFGRNGEWTKSGMMQVQYHDLTDAANLDTWRA